MKPVIYIDQSPEARFIKDCPEEPKYTDYVQHTKYYWQVNKFERAKCDYEKTLAAAKQSAILFDQEEIRSVMMIECLPKDSIHPVPDQYKVEIMDAQMARLLSTGNKHKTMPLKGQVAVLSLKPEKTKTMKDKIKESYAKVIGRDLEDDEWDLSLEGDLDMDGMDFVEFIMDLEARLQISIPDDQAENLFTPNQWLAYLKAVLKPQDKLISEPKDMKDYQLIAKFMGEPLTLTRDTGYGISEAFPQSRCSAR